MVTKKNTPKKKVDAPKEPIVVITDKETVYRFNWIMVRRKIIAFTQLFRLKRKPKPLPEEIKTKKEVCLVDSTKERKTTYRCRNTPKSKPLDTAIAGRPSTKKEVKK